MPKIVDHDERRQQHLEALWRLLERDGAGAVSIRHLAEEAGELLATLDGRVRRAVRTALGTWQSTGLVHVARDLDLEAMRLHALIDGLSLHALHIPDGIPAARLRAIVAEHLSDLAGPPRRDSH